MRVFGSSLTCLPLLGLRGACSPEAVSLWVSSSYSDGSSDAMTVVLKVEFGLPFDLDEARSCFDNLPPMGQFDREHYDGDNIMGIGVYRRILFRDIQVVLGYFDRVGFLFLAR